MVSLIQSSPLGRVFSGAGGAGPRRLAILGSISIAVLGGAGFMMLRQHDAARQSSVAKTPDVNALPGGMHSNPYYAELAVQNAQDQARQAEAQGQSSVAPMQAGQVGARPVEAQPATPAPAAVPRAPIRAVPQPGQLANPGRPYVPVRVESSAAEPPKVDDKRIQPYANAISTLFSDWSGSRPPTTDVILKPDEGQPGGSDGAASVGGAAAGPATQTAARPVAAQTEVVSTRKDTPLSVLIPAGKGVYAVTKLAASSDQGGPVVVTAESGPIAGDEMTGTFDRRGDRLVVTLNALSMPDGSQKTIDALVIAPNSMETAVASSVDQHYVARFMLPVAAAFVAGLGQAIQQSNAVVAVSPLGGYTAQNHLNFDQQLGVAAGAAGTQLQNLFLQNAPKGPTVKIAAGVNVGVVFLKPLMTGDGQ
jgi:intracellular multiplication protein IcmE